MVQPTTADLVTADVDQARIEVGNVFCPHRLIPRSGRSLCFRLRSCRLGAIGVSHLDYGAPVKIEPGVLEDFYLVQMPITGTSRIGQGTEEVISSAALASVLSPQRPVSMQWGSRNPQSIFYVERAAIERQLGRLLGRPVNTPVEFALGMRMVDPAVRSWTRTFTYLQGEIVHQSPFLEEPQYEAQLEQMLITQLLMAQPHNFSRQLREAGSIRSSVVRKACDLINAHLVEQLTVADVAEAVGVSVRTLQAGFRRELDVSPTRYLREIRLKAANAALKSGTCNHDSVTSIAMAQGFLHLGRFSVEYRRRFGESPSQTLSR